MDRATRLKHVPSVILVAFIALTALPSALAQGELLQNGGFEVGREGWNFGPHTDVTVQNKHGGLSAARLGSAYYDGVVSQTITAPSAAWTLTFWYYVGVGLNEKSWLRWDVILDDGSVLTSLVLLGDDQWHQIVYNIDDGLAGRKLTIQFTGQGDYNVVEIERTICPQPCPPNEPIVVIQVKKYPVFAFVDDVSVAPKGATLNLAGSSSNRIGPSCSNVIAKNHESEAQ